jgi:type IV secretion system protein VirB1
MSAELATLMALCAPLVHPLTLAALIQVESAGSPYALSVNYPETLARAGRVVPALPRQPRSAEEAIRWGEALMARGYTVSVGLAQINVEERAALSRELGALTLQRLFSPCQNLRAAQLVLLRCAGARHGARLEGAGLAPVLSCYNTGRADLGVRNGYVARVHAAARLLARTARARAPPGASASGS